MYFASVVSGSLDVYLGIHSGYGERLEICDVGASELANLVIGELTGCAHVLLVVDHECSAECVEVVPKARCITLVLCCGEVACSRGEVSCCYKDVSGLSAISETGKTKVEGDGEA